MDHHFKTKAVVSVSEMARMVGLSRQRFYQLRGTAFPWPLYAVATKRPFYTEELQRVCLEVRRRNRGIDGKPILFYASGHQVANRNKPTRKAVKKDAHADITSAVRALGLSAVTSDQIGQTIKVLFPGGVDGTSQSEVIRAVFLALKRQDSADNVGR